MLKIVAMGCSACSFDFSEGHAIRLSYILMVCPPGFPRNTHSINVSLGPPSLAHILRRLTQVTDYKASKCLRLTLLLFLIFIFFKIFFVFSNERQKTIHLLQFQLIDFTQSIPLLPLPPSTRTLTCPRLTGLEIMKYIGFDVKLLKH